MCGIVGVANQGMDQASRESVQRMCALIRRRGPDDDGFYFGDRVGMAMRRLAIIDVRAGHQPISNEDESVWIVFNGEIYNFLDLQRDLQSRGHTFRTKSDTECIVHLYEEYGEECVSHLRGMFAFAIWDDRNMKLLLARDRLGIKPLYYCESLGELYFASEIKALLSLPGFERKIDAHSLSEYFTYGYVPCPGTIFEDIREMPPAHIGIWVQGHLRLKRYWELRPSPNVQIPIQAFEEQLFHELEEATKLHMVSEVPLGAFLSGGIDSSAIVALMTKGASQPVKTFTVGFRSSEPRFDERQYAEVVAKKFRTDHTECLLDQRINNVLPEIVQAFDEPFADSSMIPNFLIYQAARKLVTVALSGLGGDELFAGYERYRGGLLADYYGSVPGFIRHGVVDKLVAGRRESLSGGPWTDRLKRFVKSADLPLEERYQRYMSLYSPEEKQGLFSEDLVAELTKRRALEAVPIMTTIPEGMTPLDRMLYADMNTYLPNDLLRMTDRLSMWHSLEVRVPFLDHKLVEFVATIPAKYKLHWGKKKYVLIRSLRGVLPEAILSRRKQGFSIPLGAWLRGPLRDLVRENLSPATLSDHGLFNVQAIERMLSDHDRGVRNYETQLWALIVFVVWYRTYMKADGSRVVSSTFLS